MQSDQIPDPKRSALHETGVSPRIGLARLSCRRSCSRLIRHDHETFSYVARSLNFTGYFVSPSLAQRAIWFAFDEDRLWPVSLGYGLGGRRCERSRRAKSRLTCLGS